MSHHQGASATNKNLPDLPMASAKHPALQLAFKILQGKSDDQKGLLFFDGLWAHEKLIASDASIQCFFFCPELGSGLDASSLASLYQGRAKESYRISEKTARRLSDRDRPDGFFFTVSKPQASLQDLLQKENCTLLILDALESPGNVGTILRSCDGAGIDAVLIVRKKARLTHPKLTKSSMGAILSVPVLVMDDVSELMQSLKTSSFTLYLADAAAKKNYREHHYASRTAVVCGSERFGISSPWYEGPHELLSIPMHGIGDSLNVAVAASILAYEISLQKRSHPSDPP